VRGISRLTDGDPEVIDSQVARRKFFMHSAHPTVGVSAGAAMLADCGPCSPAAVGRLRRPLRVCLVSGCPHYKSDESLAALEEYLQGHCPVACSRALGHQEGELAGLEGLEDSDCLLLFARRMTVGGKQLQRIKRYCLRGGAIVGVRTGSRALQNWPEMDGEVFGGDCRGHYGNRLTEVELVAATRRHPVLAGVVPFASRGALYKSVRIAEDATVLLTGTFPGHTHPVAWVRPYRGGRVFYTSLGHPVDFGNPSFLRLLANAVAWTAAPQQS
jgi:type 1 glutamine amidotransferase